MTVGYSESVLVEQLAVELFEKLGWETYDGFQEFETPGGSPLGPGELDLSELDIDVGGLGDGDSGTA